MKKYAFAIFFAVMLSLAGYAARAAERQQLNASEVREIFIERAWKNTSGGEFFFSANGTYTYTRNGKQGPWIYQLRSDGVIQSGNKLTYTFYRMPNGSYQYFHSRSKAFIRAFPQ